MSVRLPINVCPPLLLAVCFATSGLRANPVTGWQKDTSFGNGPTAALTAAGTSSPILGSGAANDADNVAIYAPIPLESLENGERITLSGAAQMIGTAANGDFRWGLFKDDGAPPATGGWLGYIASAESVVWSKDPAGSSFATATFASVAAGRGAVLGQAVQPSGILFNPGTYEFQMMVDRFGNEVDVQVAIRNASSGFSIVTPAFTESNPARLTFAFDRVGFLAGSALDADQIRFSGIDVTTSTIEAPTLRVHSSRQIFITNTTGQTVDLTHYEVVSNSGALNATGWTSLDDQENSDPIGIGWEEAGGSGANVLAEVNLLSMSSLGSGEGLRLGNAWTPGGAQDLAFHYTTPEGDVLRGIVDYVLTGDYNGDGAVDAADYTIWQDTLGQHVSFGAGADGDGNGLVEPADYHIWKSNFGATSGTGAVQAAAVPEPATAALLLLALSVRCARRCRDVGV